jgi:Tfp pilus assembly protein PilF
LDPGYAPAWAGLSGCFSAMAVQSMLPPGEAADKARDTAARAVELGPLRPEAHVARAAVHLFMEWNWRAAERSIQRGLELSPSFSEAHGLFMHYALARGWGDHAIASAHRALDLDPMSAAVNTDLAWAYLLDRQYSKAIEQASNIVEMKLSFPLTHMYLGQMYLCTNEHEKAITPGLGMISRSRLNRFGPN